MATILEAIECLGQKTYILDDNGLGLNIGDVCSMIDENGRTFCVTILDSSVSTPSYTAQTIYTNCENCAVNNSFSLIIENCESPLQLTIPLLSPFPSNFGESYYLSLTPIVGGKPISGCFSIFGLTDDDPRFSTTSSSIPYLNCFGCSISANSTTYLVQQCFTSNQYYVLLPVTTNIGTTISFNPNNTIDQLCGEIIREEPGTPPTAIYLADFKGCDDCLDQISVRRIIESCIDGTQQIVFGSALYNLNESSYLTINDPNEGFSGCYRIGDLTSDPVTVTGYLSYSPSPSCEECISCGGFEFEYFVCGEPGLTGETFSLQYIEVGQTFFHPLSGCCEMSSVTTAGTYNEEFLSFYEYNTCEECTGATIGYEVWLATSCNSRDQFVVVTPSGFLAGDFLTLNYGVLTQTCVELISPYTSEPLKIFAKTTEISYTDCTNCSNNTFVGYPFVNCSTNEISYYSMSLTNYGTIINNGIVRDGSYDCYFIINGCVRPIYPIIDGTYFTTCSECEAPLSAGTESTICQICCPCTSGETITSVVPPHPQWTNLQGKTISLLDAITLGGPNGLNN